MRRFIIGTDWWTDCDDAVALRLLARSAAAGEIEILGIILNGCMPYSVASLDAIIAAEGVNVPIGLDREANDFGRNPPYQKNLAAYAVNHHSNDEAEDGVALYRRLLAQAEPGVEIIEIGYPQVLRGLLESSADEYSVLSGVELVREKVSKLWMMAGKWDVEEGRENNFARNERSRRGGEAVCRLWPGPVVFLGYEIGDTVITGGGLAEDDMLRGALRDHGSENGRCSWDPMLALLAVTGDAEKAGYALTYGKASVDAETGLCRFERDDSGLHAYVTKTRDDSWYAQEINRRVVSKAIG